MAEPEKLMVDALIGTGEFAEVRYIVLASETDTDPIPMPVCVIADGGKDYTEMETICGTREFIQTYDIMVMADTAAECRHLEEVCKSTLSPLACVLQSSRIDYDGELRNYVLAMTFIQ